MRMGGGPQQFGVDAEQVPALLARARRRRPRLPRLPHLRRLAEPAAPRSSARRSARPSSWRCGWPTDAPAPVRYLNLGGGFGIPYFEKDEPLDLAAIGAEPRTSCWPTRSAPSLPEARVVIELGRYLVGEGGVYVTRVVDRKVSRGKIFLVVDGGLHHQLAASGNFGQVIRRNYPVADRQPDWRTSATETVSVVGCLCTPLDLLADRVDAARAPTSATWSSCSRPAPTA